LFIIDLFFKYLRYYRQIDFPMFTDLLVSNAVCALLSMIDKSSRCGQKCHVNTASRVLAISAAMQSTQRKDLTHPYTSLNISGHWRQRSGYKSPDTGTPICSDKCGVDFGSIIDLLNRIEIW
jgi:hypothetical protein